VADSLSPGTDTERARPPAFDSRWPPGRAHAALLFDGDEAVARAQYGTPEELPGIYHRKGYDPTTDVSPDLGGALDLIRQAGATA
jgi:hypothetical protein